MNDKRQSHKSTFQAFYVLNSTCRTHKFNRYCFKMYWCNRFHF